MFLPTNGRIHVNKSYMVKATDHITTLMWKEEMWMAGGRGALEIIYLWLSHFIRSKLKSSPLKRVYQKSCSYQSQLQQTINAWLPHTDQSWHFFLGHEIVEARTHGAISLVVQKLHQKTENEVACCVEHVTCTWSRISCRCRAAISLWFSVFLNVVTPIIMQMGGIQQHVFWNSKMINLL